MSLKHVQCVLPLLVAAGLAVGLCGCAGTGGGRGLPEWVRDPSSLNVEFPRSRYFVGTGVCGGANPRDVMSRKQAESAAVADIASVVEVQINDTIEDHDTSVERNGQLLEQNVRIQTTRRVITGLLSGVEIKRVFFDERALTWHALAVLDRSRAGAGAAEAVEQRLTHGQAILDGLGSGPLSDYMALRRLEQTATELDRLAVALAIFAPSRQADAKTRIEAFKADVVRRRDTAQSRAGVRIVMFAKPPGALPDELRDAAARALQQAGFNVVKADAAGDLHVDIEIRTGSQVGAMRIFEVSSGATFRLLEEGRTLAEGSVPVDTLSASRSSSEHLARSRSLNLLAARLRMGIAAMLQAGGE